MREDDPTPYSTVKKKDPKKLEKDVKGEKKICLCLSLSVFLVYPKIVGSSINSDIIYGVLFYMTC